MAKPKQQTKQQAKQAVRSQKNAPRFWPYGLLLFAALLFIDQYTKHVIVTSFVPGQSVRLFPGFWYTYVQNTGTAWGFLPGANGALVWLSVVAFGLLIFYFDKFESVVEKISYTMLLAGLWGNLLDRGVHGFVVDFIDLGWWPVFNIADACITVGIILFLISQLKKDFGRSPRKASA
jgi:signal peptidase II